MAQFLGFLCHFLVSNTILVLASISLKLYLIKAPCDPDITNSASKGWNGERAINDYLWFSFDSCAKCCTLLELFLCVVMKNTQEPFLSNIGKLNVIFC